MSTNTGVKLQYNATAAVALNLIDGTRTFFLGLNLFIFKATCKAAVQELKPTAYFEPIYLLNFSSNSFTVDP